MAAVLAPCLCCRRGAGPSVGVAVADLTFKKINTQFKIEFNIEFNIEFAISILNSFFIFQLNPVLMMMLLQDALGMVLSS